MVGTMPSAHHLPPAVRYPVERQRLPGYLGGLLWLLAAAVLLAWWRHSAPQPIGVLGVAGMLWLAAGGAQVHAWRTAPQGLLQWDGGAWWWQAQGDVEPQPLQVLQLRIDLQTAVLLAWRGTDGRWQHAWLLQRSAPWRWGDWRRAVYSAATVFRQTESAV